MGRMKEKIAHSGGTEPSTKTYDTALLFKLSVNALGIHFKSTPYLS